mgnify:CR=1 FL=1
MADSILRTLQDLAAARFGARADALGPDDDLFDNLAELVVKEVHGSGGYGMLIGPTASKAEIEEFRAKLKENPEGYIAQPTLALSALSPNASGATQTPTEHSVGSRPETVSWGWFPLDKPPVLTIASGDTVRIEMLDERRHSIFGAIERLEALGLLLVDRHDDHVVHDSSGAREGVDGGGSAALTCQMLRKRLAEPMLTHT